MTRFLYRVFQATEELNRRTILETLLPSPGATLVDLGCGDGSFTTRVAKRVQAGRVIGVELVRSLAAQARRRSIEVVEADLAAPLPFGAGTVDVVHANQVIEHLASPDHLLREIRRILAPTGYAVLSTNNLASLHNIASLLLGWQPAPCHVSDEVIVGNPASFARGDPGARPQMHLRLFTARALASLAEHHGLRVEVARSAGYYPLPPRLAKAMARLDPVRGAYLIQRYRPA